MSGYMGWWAVGEWVGGLLVRNNMGWWAVGEWLGGLLREWVVGLLGEWLGGLLGECTLYSGVRIISGGQTGRNGRSGVRRLLPAHGCTLRKLR